VGESREREEKGGERDERREGEQRLAAAAWEEGRDENDRKTAKLFLFSYFFWS
jgi:hypothetical protein